MKSVGRLLVAWVAMAAALPMPALATDENDWEFVQYEPKPATYEELPLGGPTQVPWIQKGQLHIGDAVIETEANVLTGRSGTYIVSKGRRSPVHDQGWWIVRGTRLKKLPSNAETRLPYVSANGRWIAWIDTRSRLIPDHDPSQDFEELRQRVVLYDAIAGKKVAVHKDRRISDVEDRANALALQGLDNTGRALVEWGETGVFVFGPDGRVVPLKVKARYTTEWDSWPGGAMLIRYHNGPSAVFGRVSQGGRFREVGGFYSGTGYWSSTGDQFVQPSSGSEWSGAYVYRLEDGTVVELGIPEVDDYVDVVGWESETSVLLWRYTGFGVKPKTGFLLRCDSASGDCERVADGPTSGRGITLPRLN